MAGERGIPLLIDATASGGWLPVDVTEVHSISLLTLARTVWRTARWGCYTAMRVPLAPQLHGGVQQGGLRAGTENLAAIVGAGAASALPAIEVTPPNSNCMAVCWSGLNR